MGNFGKSAKGGPFAKLSILAIFLAQLRQARKSSILVRFEPNQYGWMRNLFQFLMIPKTLSNNKNQLRNRNIFKGYSFENGQKWPPSKGYRLCKIVTLAQKLKMHKNMLKTFLQHIAVVLCKKRLEKTANIGKMRAF